MSRPDAIDLRQRYRRERPAARDEESNIQRWRRLSSRPLSSGYIHVDEDLVRLPDGRQLSYQVLRASGFACVCPVTTDGRVALSQQYRYPLDEVICELPAGAIEPSESPLRAAQRETAEEVGLASDDWVDLGSFWTMPGRGDEVAHLFLARNAIPVERPRQEEHTEVVLESFDAALQRVVTVRDALCLRLAQERL
jgi:ADP-ribose pyrophosphatase